MTIFRRELSAARFGPRFRLFLARRPWARWLCVAVIAAVAAVVVHDRMRAIDAARAEWADHVSVPVAIASVGPDEPVTWRWRELPAIAIPDDVATDVPDDARARRHIGVGEIIVAADLSVGDGPAAAAGVGEVVVPVSDPLVARAEMGIEVAVYADGLVLAASGRVVRVEAEVVFVAVDASDAPIVAAASRSGQASLGFIGSG